MVQVAGKYATADIFLNQVDNNVISQTINILNHPMMEGAIVRLMPDCHLGAGAPIGFTAKLDPNKKITAPDLVGTDINCGVLAYNLGKQDFHYPYLDGYIRKNIPSGGNVREKVSKKINNPKLIKNIEEVSNRLEMKSPLDRHLKSIGTLGSGNHFIEIAEDEEKNKWLIIHSGSRNFGLSVCQYYNKKSDEKIVGIKTITGDLYDEYIYDMTIAGEFASLSRELMARDIIEDFFVSSPEKHKYIHSVHNYHDLEDNTIRKGATPARKGEELIIPFNMKDGSIIGVGKGNDSWNNSALHGSGRKMSRSAAKKRLCIEDFKRQMEGVYSTCITKRFLDEAPKAYKKVNTVLEFLGETLDITQRLKPVFNFKG